MIDNALHVHNGGCLCGSVRYIAQGQPLVVAHCHCKDCQRGTGAGHSTVAMFSIDRFQLMGRVAEFKMTSENGNEVTRVFCPTCGSPIYGTNSGMKGHVSIHLGTIDESATFEPQVVIFARNLKPWDDMDKGLLTFNAQPNWAPGDDV
ncbi:MAG: GFA family protein [Magnetovibrio sp.]|nr:GFA family protein [Magnetovibrio sp.]